MSNIYFAAALDTEGRRLQNLTVVRMLEAEGHTVYLPQRDGGLFSEMIAGGAHVRVAAKKVFDNDVAAIERCDFVVATLNDNPTRKQPMLDHGVLVEIGIAFMAKKPTIVRGNIRDPLKLNPMLIASIHKHVGTNWLDLLEAIK